jgi:methionine biosynthesis protein MetW
MYRHKAALRLVKQQPVLDVGTGDGLFLRMLRDAGVTDAVGIDLSDVGARKARAAHLDVRVVDASDGLPFGDRTFGTVCALDVLEHTTNPRDLLAELARVGHDVVVTVPNFHHWRQRLQVLIGHVPFQMRPGRGHVFWFNEQILLGLGREVGLVPAQVLSEPGARLGPLGVWLAARQPRLFAVSLAVRFISSP